MDASMQVFHYLENPSIVPDDWALRVQFLLLFLKKIIKTCILLKYVFY
jgi:hypothetical protein